MRFPSYIVVAALCLAGSAATAQPFKAVAIPYPAPDTPAATAMEIFINELDVRSGGALSISKRPWTSPADTLRALQSRDVEFAIVPTPAITRVEKAFAVYEMPFLFEDLGAVSRFQAGKGGKILGARLEEKGLVELALIHEGMSVIASNRPLRDLAQLKGVKFAALPYNTPTTKLWRDLGATVAFSKPRDIVAALEAGMLDSYVGPMTLINPSTLPRTTLVITLTRHEYFGFVLLASAKFLRTLTPGLREHVRTAGQLAGKKANALSIDLLARKDAEFVKAGAQVVRLTGAELDTWRGAASAEWSAFRAGRDAQLLQLALASGTGGGGDPCDKLNECRCPDRTCKPACCVQPSSR